MAMKVTEGNWNLRTVKSNHSFWKSTKPFQMEKNFSSGTEVRYHKKLGFRLERVAQLQYENMLSSEKAAGKKWYNEVDSTKSDDGKKLSIIPIFQP